MFSFQHYPKRRYTCGIIMVQRLWNRFRSLFLSLCELKLNLLLWFFCVLLVVFLVFVCRLGAEENEYQPVIVWWTEGFPGSDDTVKTCDDHLCRIVTSKNVNSTDAFLFYGSQMNFEHLPLPRNPSKVIWGLYHEESPRNLEFLMHERALSLFNYSSTFSRYSDVPFVLQYLDSLNDVTSTEYFVPTVEKNGFLAEISPVLYLQTDCETTTERDDYVLELMKHIKVDSYGECLNNRKLPDTHKIDYLNNLDEDEFLKFISRYKFTIAIENAVCEDYITEKFWRTLKVGSVPLYFGSPTIADWLPNPKSAILLQNYSSPLEVANYLKVLLNNDTLYEEHLEHKVKKVITNRQLVGEFAKNPDASDALRTSETFECFICLKLHNRKRADFIPSVVNKKHYDCPSPLSALKERRGQNSWLFSWSRAGKEAERIYSDVMKTK